MKDLMKFWLGKQIEGLKSLLECNEKFIDSAPKGALKIRNRNGREELRRVTQHPRTEHSITKDPLAIAQLIQKEISEEAIRRCENNLKHMEQLRNKYLPIDTMAIKETLPESHRHLIKPYQDILYRHWSNQEYHKRFADQSKVIHTTHKGERVSSKSEVILANSLYENGIPYHYDERSIVTSDWGNHYYYDFVIPLPNGDKIYWEHLGMLSNREYMEHSLQKLYHYHQEGITIGRNLIITVDDVDGNCDSLAIYNIIQYMLLPHFR